MISRVQIKSKQYLMTIDNFQQNVRLAELRAGLQDPVRHRRRLRLRPRSRRPQGVHHVYSENTLKARSFSLFKSTFIFYSKTVYLCGPAV